MSAVMDKVENGEVATEQQLKEFPVLWHSIKGVIEITSLGETFIRDEMAAGRLRSIKVGRARRISDRDLRAWMGQYDPSAK